MPTASTNFVLNLEYAMPMSQVFAYFAFGGATNYTLVASNNPPTFYTYSKMGFTSNALLLTGADILSIFLYTVVISAGVEVARLAFTK